ncbi:MAG: hypothetical protein ACJA0Q_000633 [Saprospiraceae bacterium]|jgi:hypothetical protein
MKKGLLISMSLMMGVVSVNAQVTSDFENLPLAAGTYWTGTASSADSTFNSGDADFPNKFGAWWEAGWAFSNVKDSVTAGLNNNYGSRAGSGYAGSANYVVGKTGAKVILTSSWAGKQADGMYVTNGTYAARSMGSGDSFAKKFGGVTGDDPDWFLLTIKAYVNGSLTTDSVNFYLADFRDSDNSKDYIVKDWQWVNLQSLGYIDSLVFSLNSSDVGAWGMNTPAYFCMDNFVTSGVPISVEEQHIAGVNLYPNPSYDILNVKGAVAGSVLQIIDVMGKVVKKAIVSSELTTFDVGNLKGGIYILNTLSNGVLTQGKFIKE